MAEPLFTSLLHTLDKNNIARIAASLGESEHDVSRGMESSIASILGSLASRSNDPGALRRLLDLVPVDLGEISWSKLAAGVINPGSSWTQTGRQMLSALFPSGHSAVANAVARDCGASPASATSMLAMAAPMVLSGLGRQVQDRGWSTNELGSALGSEGTSIRSALPAGVSELVWPRELVPMEMSPVIAQSIQREKSSSGWLGALALATTALGCFWLWTHVRRPVENMAAAATGEANRLANEAGGVVDYVKRRLPGGVELNVPANGTESRLVGVINGTFTADRDGWLDFDSVLFDSGSSTLRPASSTQLDNIAAILKAYPHVRLGLAGYTDDAGGAQQNLELSRARADSVKKELVSRGISADRLSTQGFGEVASTDNSTAAARAANRRVSLRVTQR